MQAKADLHVHSRYSDRPSEWILRRIGAPESYVCPVDLYEQARKRGMDFVTITDHNSISGALEIAHLPNTFLSSEITTYFPEDACKIHVVVLDITEAQFRDIQDVRANIYDFQRYLLEADIVHTLAHPLFAVNEKLHLEHVEKLLLLFNRWETLNGTRHTRANRVAEALLDQLDPELIRELADAHGIEPVGPEPWKKLRTGGSDDHSGRYVAAAHTLTPRATTVEEFSAHLRQGQHLPAGTSGTSVRLAHSFYHIAYSYYKDRLTSRGRTRSPLLDFLMERFADEKARAPEPRAGSRIRNAVQRVLQPLKRARLPETERALWNEFSCLLDTESHPLVPEVQNDPGTDRRAFEFACRVSQNLGYHCLDRFTSHLQEASLLESVQTFSALGPVFLSIAPYLAAFVTQHKDGRLLTDLMRRFAIPEKCVYGGEQRKAWVTDTFDDINGVAKTIQTLAELAKSQGKELTVLTCLEETPCKPWMRLQNFAPVGMFQLPEYHNQKLAFPPFLEIIEFLERGQFSEILISTPGPLGLTALAAGRLLGLKTTGIYHTDFPKYVQVLTEDEAMTQLTWRFMCWFYGQLDHILAPSEWYRNLLRENGLGHKEISVLPRGIDTRRFSPKRRDATFWGRFNCNGNFKFLYVGRVSKEKNIEHLLESFTRLHATDTPADLIVVGDGPLLKNLRKRYRDRADIIFTGFLHGETLAKAYASADAFVFPSTTDTFGNVVLEAQASGLPCIVADEGGPSEIVGRCDSGLVVNMHDREALVRAMTDILTDRNLHGNLGRRALQNARNSSWPRVFDLFWETPAETAAQETSA